MAYEIFDEQPDGGRRVYLRASTVLTPYVFAEERPRRITDEERAVLERFLEPDEPATAPHDAARRATTRATCGSPTSTSTATSTT